MAAIAAATADAGEDRLRSGNIATSRWAGHPAEGVARHDAAQEVHAFVRNLAQLAEAAAGGRLEATESWDAALPAKAAPRAWRPAREREAEAVAAMERHMQQAAARSRGDAQMRQETADKDDARQAGQAAAERLAAAALRRTCAARTCEAERSMEADMRALCIVPWPAPVLRMMMRRRGWL